MSDPVIPDPNIISATARKWWRSSKRLFGLGCFLAAVGFGIGGNALLAGEFLGAAVVVFTGQAITKT